MMYLILRFWSSPGYGPFIQIMLHQSIATVSIDLCDGNIQLQLRIVALIGINQWAQSRGAKYCRLVTVIGKGT